MKPSIFFKLVTTTIKKMKAKGCREANCEQWLVDLKGCLLEELSENCELYPDEEGEK